MPCIACQWPAWLPDAAVPRGDPQLARAQVVPIDSVEPLRALFEFHVRQGPSAGLKLGGDLTLDIDFGGGLSGTWALISGGAVDVVGQATGHAVSLLLSLSDGRRVFGTGTADRALADAPTVIGGIATGPADGDVADWLIAPTGGTPSKPGCGGN